MCIVSVSLCTLHQYQTVSVCYDLLITYNNTILSARFFAPCPAPAPAFLLTTCNVLSHLYVSTSDSAAGALSVEAVHWAVCEHKRVRRQCRECGGGITCEHKRNSAASSRVAHACWATLQSRRDWGYRVWHVPYQWKMSTDFRIVGDRGEGLSTWPTHNA